MKICCLLLLFVQFACKTVSSDNTSVVSRIIERYAEEVIVAVGNDTECVDQLKIFLSDLRNVKPWALRMVDSWGKIQPGILTGNIIFLGNYDECLDINVMRNRSQIKGQYCSTEVRPKEAARECAHRKLSEKQISTELESASFINWDLCLPAACSANDFQKIWDFIEDRYQFPFHVVFKDEQCSTVEKQNSYTKFQILAILMFCGIGGIVLVSTIYDVLIFQNRKDKTYNVLMAFSYYTNFKRLVSTERAQETHITCLYGLRVISMAWIILGHRHLFALYFLTSINNLYYLEWLKHDENMFIEGALACVDTFFVISGCLIVYTIMLAKERGISINLFVFWGHRFLRLQPSLAAIILLYLGILPHLGSGPFWYAVVNNLQESCRTDWWPTLLHIQNYYNPLSACIVQSWYLAVDTHLYLLSPLLFLPLQRWPKITIALIIGLTAASVGTSIYLTFYYNINNESLRSIFDYYQYLYNPTHTRATPWLLGTILGYVVFQTKGKNIVIKKPLVVLLWIATVGTLLAILYPYNAFMKYKFSTLLIALFIGFSRIGWGLCICWVIFACARGYGGYINTFLSLPVFRVLARLTYAIYLTHYLMTFVVKGQSATHTYVSNLFDFHDVWGDFAFSVGLGLIWTLTFESPVTILENVLIKRELQKHDGRTTNHVSELLGTLGHGL